MALAIDASTPAIAVQSVAIVATVATASFTPPAGSLLIIRWSGDTAGGATPSTPTITDNLGVHLTYTLLDFQSRASAPTVDGQAASWWAVVGASTAMTVTVTSQSISGNRLAALNVTVMTGQNVSTPIGAHGKSGSASTSSIAQSYTAQATNSWGFIGVLDWDVAGPETAGSGCTLEGSANIGIGDTYGFVRRTSADGSNGASNSLNVTLPGTSNNLSWVYLEVLPDIPPGTQIDGFLPIIPINLIYQLALREYTKLQNSDSPSISDTNLIFSGISSSELIGNSTISLVISANSIFSEERIGPSTITTTVTINTNSINSNEYVGNANVTTITSISTKGITNEEKFGNTTVNASYSTLASGISSSENIGNPIISSTYTINANGINTSENIGNTTSNTSYTINANSISTSENIGNPTITIITSINANGITSLEKLGLPTVTPGAVNINANGINSNELLGNLNAITATSVFANGITSLEKLGSPSITSIATINANGIISEINFGNSIINTTITINANGISSTERFGSSSVTAGAVSVNANSINSLESFGIPNISSTIIISANGIISKESFGQTSITASVNLFAAGIDSSERFSATVVTTGLVSITAKSLTSSEVFGLTTVTLGSPSIFISANGILSNEKFGYPHTGHKVIIRVLYVTPNEIIYQEPNVIRYYDTEIIISEIE